MRKFGRRALTAGLCVTLGVSGLAMTGCKKDGGKTDDKKGETGVSSELDPNVEEISLLCFGQVIVSIMKI